MAARDETLEFVRRPLRDDLAPVEDGDPMGEPVRLLEVLRRQEDRDAAGDEVADDLPHHPPTPRVEACGRLVEEDDPRVADEGHRQVEPASHPPGEGRKRLLRRFDQIEPLEQLGGAPAALALAEVTKIRHQDQVLLAGQEAIDGRELTRHADRSADGVGFAADVVAGDLDLAVIRGDQRREDVDRCRLPGTVRPEQGEHRARGDLEVDAVKHEVLAVRPAQPDRADRGRVPEPGHRPSSA